MTKKVYAMLMVLLGLLFNTQIMNAQNKKNGSGIKNVILVHGAFVDGAGWKGVYDILTSKGFNVKIAQIPLTDLNDDVTVIKRMLDVSNGPTVLVGHSWGGAVITEASNHPNVASLVYVTAFQPDQGENTWKWVTFKPALPENGILPPDNNGFVYYDREKFNKGFAGGVSKEQALFMADSQKPIAAESFMTVLSNAAWHSKPTFGIIPTEDKSINPLILKAMYDRSKTNVTEVKGGSHSVYITHPIEVAEVIQKAAK